MSVRIAYREQNFKNKNNEQYNNSSLLHFFNSLNHFNGLCSFYSKSFGMVVFINGSFFKCFTDK